MERGAWREMSPNCPRCGSSDTKFCYYNNYSLTQPRYFCKGCRRYWTKGGSLRNVPIGGGCRKSRRGNKPSLRLIGTTAGGHGVGGSTLLPSRNTTSAAFGRRGGITSGCCPVNAHDNGSYINSMNRSLATHDNDHHHHRQSSFIGAAAADPPPIDLAVVYANFLNSKPAAASNHDDRGCEIKLSGADHDQPGSEFNPNFELMMTSIGPVDAPHMINSTTRTEQMQREENHVIVECPGFSDRSGSILPMFIGTNEFDTSVRNQQEDQQINVATTNQLGSTPPHHHRHRHCTTTTTTTTISSSKGFGLMLPPLPGEDHQQDMVVPWPDINDHCHDHLFLGLPAAHTQTLTSAELLEPGQAHHHHHRHHQSFIDSSSCWSPLDLSSYETSSRPL